MTLYFTGLFSVRVATPFSSSLRSSMLSSAISLSIIDEDDRAICVSILGVDGANLASFDTNIAVTVVATRESEQTEVQMDVRFVITEE